LAHRKEADKVGDGSEKHTGTINEPEVYMSVVIPAYNEEERLEIMLEEAVAFLDAEYGRAPRKGKGKANGQAGKTRGGGMGGYEILIVNDGSTDRTVDIALAFSKRHNLHDILRICTLQHNRGKGGAVTHGFRHVRGAYAIFADADGASKFEDLAKLVEGCEAVADESNRSIAVGSRAHLVGSEAVVKVCPTTPRRGDIYIMLTLRTSVLLSETPSCIPFTSSSGCLPHPPRLASGTRSAASSSSPGHRYHT
jgi:dolichyl-phosphate beta-glucosyltransferase